MEKRNKKFLPHLYFLFFIHLKTRLKIAINLPFLRLKVLVWSVPVWSVPVRLTARCA